MPTPIGGEMAWWCPSLDETGNGTATLHDLVGSANGTLTNMDSATDWVADTANGGVRALDFDGVNDTALIGNVLNSLIVGASAKFSVSAWVYLLGDGVRAIVTKLGDSTHSENQRQLAFLISARALNFFWYGDLSASSFRVVRAEQLIPLATWTHVAATFDATISDSNLKANIFINGELQSVTLPFASGTPASIPTGLARLAIGSAVGQSSSVVGYPFLGRIDDVRFFSGILSYYQMTLLASMRGRQLLQGGRRRRYSGGYGL